MVQNWDFLSDDDDDDDDTEDDEDNNNNGKDDHVDNNPYKEVKNKEEKTKI